MQYDEHELPEKIRSNFNVLNYKINNEDCKKEVFPLLMRDRANPHDWIEFHNDPDVIYTCVYYYLGAYLIRFNTKGNEFNKNKSNYQKIIKNFNWYENFKLNKTKKYLFSLTEVIDIINDIYKLNKLSLFG